MLEWVLAGFTGLSALTAAAALLRLGTQRSIDQETLNEMRRKAAREQEEREAKRRREDDERERKRITDDERRREVLASELAALTRRSNERFQQWQDAIADLDELWAAYEDDLMPWIRKAQRKLNDAGIDIEPPPTLRRLHRHRPQPIGDMASHE